MSIRAKGTLLQYENPTSTWNTIPGIKSFAPPNRAVGIIDGTDHDSTAREKQSDDLPDNGQVTISGNYDSENTHHQYLEDHIGDTLAFKVIYKDSAGTTAATHAFSGIVRDFSTQANYDGVLEFTCVVEVTGAITRS